MSRTRMRFSIFIHFVIACSLLFAAGVASAASAAHDRSGRAVDLGQEFKLKAGRQVAVKGTKLWIRFVGVSNDSRCPKDVQCVWAGNAAVRLLVSAGRSRQNLTLNTNKSPTLTTEAQFHDYNIKLIELSPYPRKGHKIAARSYTATLLISKE